MASNTPMSVINSTTFSRSIYRTLLCYMPLKHFRPGGSFSKLKITNGMDTIKDNYSQSARRGFHDVVHLCFHGNRKTTLKYLSICLSVQTYPTLTIEQFPGPHLHSEIGEAMNYRFRLRQMKIAIIRSEVE